MRAGGGARSGRMPCCRAQAASSMQKRAPNTASESDGSYTHREARGRVALRIGRAALGLQALALLSLLAPARGAGNSVRPRAALKEGERRRKATAHTLRWSTYIWAADACTPLGAAAVRPLGVPRGSAAAEPALLESSLCAREAVLHGSNCGSRMRLLCVRVCATSGGCAPLHVVRAPNQDITGQQGQQWWQPPFSAPARSG